MSKTEEGILLIADISGYTGYLSTAELEHAEEILTVLLELLVNQTRPPLIISRLAGDAVISYGLRDNFFQGQTFIELIESTYLAFRKAIELMVINNNCRCNACANISNLDLKFFVHYGTFALQQLDRHSELLGSDVNLIHRLLKNQVTEQTGLRAYTLFTEAALRQLGLEEMTSNLAPHSETYEHLGEVKVWIQDMHAVWQQKRDRDQTVIPPERIALQIETEIAMPPALVWDYLVQPEYRQTLLASDRVEVVDRQGGRIASGSAYHCYHGNHVVPQTILEWRPFERMLTHNSITLPLQKPSILVEFRLDPTENGTRLVQIFSKAQGPLVGRFLVDREIRSTAQAAQNDLEAFKRRIEAEQAGRGTLPQTAISAGAAQEAAADSLRGGQPEN